MQSEQKQPLELEFVKTEERDGLVDGLEITHMRRSARDSKPMDRFDPSGGPPNNRVIVKTEERDGLEITHMLGNSGKGPRIKHTAPKRQRTASPTRGVDYVYDTESDSDQDEQAAVATTTTTNGPE